MPTDAHADNAKRYDVIVVGAGAAGLFCAARIGRSGKRVAVLDHSATLGEKIRISGGGRCNFTNINTAPENFISENLSFCRSALARFTPHDFIKQLNAHGITWHEKHRGQLFCDGSAMQIVRMLESDCIDASVKILHPVKLAGVRAIERDSARFALETSAGELTCASVVVACGGLSIPKIGASDLGYRIARQFNIPVVSPRPALVPLTFDAETWNRFDTLAGVALEVRLYLASATIPLRSTPAFTEDLLFTHRGLSGPAILQISSYWTQGDSLSIDLSPATVLDAELRTRKNLDKRAFHNVLGDFLPQRLADAFAHHSEATHAGKKLADLSDAALRTIGNSINNWRITPNGSEGYRRAEVTVGGVDTRALSSKTMQSDNVEGLYFIGEVLDVTGWLGGYNFQWAWASAVAAATALTLSS